MTAVDDALAEAAGTVEAELERLLPAGQTPEARLVEAMRHAVLAGGKRLRPFLVLKSADLFGVAPDAARRAAAAVEMVHTYSLVHDDLPAMDDDDLRRGRPTVHKAYDEATAVLAGDALLTRAFEVLADPATHSDGRVRADLVSGLARAAGMNGMVGGQMLDLQAEHTAPDVPGITRLQRLKTGGLMMFACDAGALLGKATETARQALTAYAHDLGLAFQIVDDLLDAEATSAELGKTAGKDAAAGKATFVSLLGAERARDQANMLVDQAVRHLDHFDGKAEPLADVARYVLARRG